MEEPKWPTANRVVQLLAVLLALVLVLLAAAQVGDLAAAAVAAHLP